MVGVSSVALYAVTLLVLAGDMQVEMSSTVQEKPAVPSSTSSQHAIQSDPKSDLGAKEALSGTSQTDPKSSTKLASKVTLNVA